MKNVQIRDGADNATCSIFRATESEFSSLFPKSGQDIELIEDFVARHHENHVARVLNNLWLRPVHKINAVGIHGTLFYNYADKRHHLPASKREIDRDPSQINMAERELYASMREDGAAMTIVSPPVTTAKLLGEIPGGLQLLAWFDGRAPSFHDAEVLALSLDREKARCNIKIHTFQMSSEVDAKGFFVLSKHVVVSFLLEGVTNLELNGFNHQNVIFGLALSRTADQSFRLEFDPCYGVSGFVEAPVLKIGLKPGNPRDNDHSN